MIYRKSEHPDEFDIAIGLVNKLFGYQAVKAAREAGEVAVVNPNHIRVIDEHAAKRREARAAKKAREELENPTPAKAKKPRKPRKKRRDTRSRKRWLAFNRFVDKGHEDFTPAEQTVWMKVFRHVGPDDTVVVSNDFLMRGTGRSRTIVIDALRKMQTLGYLRLVGLIPSQEVKARRFAWLYEPPAGNADSPPSQGDEKTLTPPIGVIHSVDTASPLSGPK